MRYYARLQIHLSLIINIHKHICQELAINKAIWFMLPPSHFTPHQVLGDSTLLSRHSLLDLLQERETGEGFFNYLAPTYKLVLMLPRKWIRSSQKQRIESGTAFCVTTILGAIYVIYLGQGCWVKLCFYETSYYNKYLVESLFLEVF